MSLKNPDFGNLRGSGEVCGLRTGLASEHMEGVDRCSRLMEAACRRARTRELGYRAGTHTLLCHVLLRTFARHIKFNQSICNILIDGLYG